MVQAKVVALIVGAAIGAVFFVLDYFGIGQNCSQQPLEAPIREQSPPRQRRSTVPQQTHASSQQREGSTQEDAGTSN